MGGIAVISALFVYLQIPHKTQMEYAHTFVQEPERAVEETGGQVHEGRPAIYRLDDGVDGCEEEVRVQREE
jgi:hypothetical protein